MDEPSRASILLMVHGKRVLSIIIAKISEQECDIIYHTTQNGIHKHILCNWAHHKKTEAFNQISNVDEYGGWAGTHLNRNYVEFSSDGTIIHLFLIS